MIKPIPSKPAAWLWLKDGVPANAFVQEPNLEDFAARGWTKQPLYVAHTAQPVEVDEDAERSAFQKWWSEIADFNALQNLRHHEGFAVWLARARHAASVGVQQPTEPLVQCLGRLVDGIRWWASQEDGVPEQLASPLQQALMLLRWPTDNADKPQPSTASVSGQGLPLTAAAYLDQNASAASRDWQQGWDACREQILLAQQPASAQVVPFGYLVTAYHETKFYKDKEKAEDVEQAYLHFLRGDPARFPTAPAPVYLAPPPATREVPEACEWTQDHEEFDTGVWSAACGMKGWHFPDGGIPSDHGMKFCHHCSKPIHVTAPAATKEGA